MIIKLEPQDWMKQAESVMNALGGQARFVGGCVRNALLGEPVEDVDLATPLEPTEVMRKLEVAEIKFIPTGLEHGTITALVNKQSFEITTLRRDIETDGRRAVVAFTQDWKEDAQRRDFTINTLMSDREGTIFDPLGVGLEDIKARRVVFVGDPAARIAEDHLRILRYFRFFALYGHAEPDARALAACRAGADKIKELSRERITQEFFKILSAPKPQDILDLMFSHHVLKDFEFAAYSSEFMGHLCEFQARFGLAFIASRLLALAGFEEKNIAAFDQYLLIPKVFKKDMQVILSILSLPDLSTDKAVRIAVYKYGRTATAQALMIELTQDRVMNGYAPKALEIIQKWDIPQFPISGDDLIAQGISPGPALGTKLAELEKAWINRGFMD